MGKVVVITGGSRGIGAATARLAAQSGWVPVITYKERKGQAEEVVAAIRAEGGEALAIAGDTACEEDVARFFNVAEETFGPVEGLVNNAGTAGSRGHLVGIYVKETKEILAVNVLGVMLCAQEAVRRP